MKSTSEASRFQGGKLRLAREFRGRTLSELAESVAVSAGYVHHLEVGFKQPSAEMGAALAEALAFAVPFFYVPLVDEFREEEVQFRAPKSMTAKLRTRVLSHGTLFQQFVALLEKRVRLPAVAVPTINAVGESAVEGAAEKVRQGLGLGLDRPISNLTRLVERLGVVVTAFEGAGKFDAFSRPVVGRRPVIVLNTDKGSSSRSRFDSAHEFGHLVLHAESPGYDAAKEADANAFASALLLPRAGFLREFPATGRIDWNGVFALKRRWKASAAAIIRRAFTLRRISPLEYRRAWKHYMYRGWNHGEPDEPEAEAPELIPNAMKVLTRKVQPRGVARELGWTREIFETVVGVPCTGEEAVESAGNVIPLKRP